jgi:putative protease
MMHSHLPEKKRLPELLAPAGSPDAFRAAIATGADAVYLSGTQFGARKFARNFSFPEIAEAVRSAHAWDVRTYVTVNTLVHDTELAEVSEYLVGLYSLGVDAVLVQDLGVASLAREIVPDLPLHASTQLTLHSADGVQWAKEQGFSRAVLARELPMSEVRAIARSVESRGIGLEVFVHGALCYCYSGQCLLSSVIGGRSGNRGQCAQPCRKPYDLVTGERDEYGRLKTIRALPSSERFLLSPQDLCTYDNLPELVNSPVASLKIEGRMKSPEYVATVVSMYRRALDAIAAGNWQPDDKERMDLLLAFNRSFTGGYLFNCRHETLMGRKRPDNRGLCIGKVVSVDDRHHRVSVKCELPVDLHAGDGIVFSLPDHPEAAWGCSLNNEPVRSKGMITFTVPHDVKPGTLVSISSSGALLQRARQIMKHPPPDLRHPVPLDLAVHISPDETMTFTGTIHARTGKPVIVQCTPDIRLAAAQSHPLSSDQLAHQMKKTGGTPFAIQKFTLDYSGGMFAPIAVLNRARREFLALVQERLVGAAVPPPDQITRAQERCATRFPASPSGAHENIALTRDYVKRSPEDSLQPVSLAVYADRVESIRAAIKNGSDIVYFEPDIFAKKNRDHKPAMPGSVAHEFREALALCRDTHTRVVWKLPRITRQDFLDEVLPIMADCRDEGLDECMVDGTGAFHALSTRILGIHLSGSSGLNVFNHQSVIALASLPFRLLTLSPELSLQEISILAKAAWRAGNRTELAVIVQGSIEAVISEDCLIQPFRHCPCPPYPAGRTDEETYGIRDETGHIFPVRVDAECRTHIGNAVETCLVDHLPKLVTAGIRSFIIDARGRTPQYTGEMIAMYREALTHATHPDQDTSRRLAALKEQVKQRAWGGITAGPFLTGLKSG